MKTLCLILTIVGTQVALGEMKFPNSVHELADLSKATEQAKASNKPLAFIVTNKATSCGICISATQTAMRELKSKTELVYVKSGSSAMPESVKTGMRQASGKYMPTVVVTDAAASKVIASFGYNNDAGFKKAIDEAEKKIRAAKATAQ